MTGRLRAERGRAPWIHGQWSRYPVEAPGGWGVASSWPRPDEIPLPSVNRVDATVRVADHSGSETQTLVVSRETRNVQVATDVMLRVHAGASVGAPESRRRRTGQGTNEGSCDAGSRRRACSRARPTVRLLANSMRAGRSPPRRAIADVSRETPVQPRDGLLSNRALSSGPHQCACCLRCGSWAIMTGH